MWRKSTGIQIIMPAQSTTILENLSESFIRQVQEEIKNVPEELWINHAPNNHSTALNQGKSIHLNWPLVNPIPVPMPTYPNLFPNLMNFIKQKIKNNYLGRVYIHRLKQEQKIIKHRDSVIIDSSNLLHRFHIYLDIPNTVELVVDDAIDSEPQRFKFSLVDFALMRTHYYKNCSAEDWIFIVFDSCSVDHNTTL